LRDTFSHQKERLLLAVGIVVLGTVATYLVLFMPTYGVQANWACRLRWPSPRP
jgi:MHS family proline/betaine transporter-like MFS transporter